MTRIIKSGILHLQSNTERQLIRLKGDYMVDAYGFGAIIYQSPLEAMQGIHKGEIKVGDVILSRHGDLTIINVYPDPRTEHYICIEAREQLYDENGAGIGTGQTSYFYTAAALVGLTIEKGDDGE